jgi:predicted nucleotidyltransferase
MVELPAQPLQEIVRRLVESLQPRAIYLFGSHAYGKPARGSDVDILVEVGDDRGCPRDLADRGRQTLAGIGTPVDLVVCTSAEVRKWSDVKCNLIHTVLEKGRLVYASGRRAGRRVAVQGG